MSPECTLEILACIFLSVLYVGSLYIWTGSHGRDHPSTIKKRCISVFFMTFISPLFVVYFRNEETQEKMISGLSLSLLGYSEGVVLAFPGVILAQWETQSKITLTTVEISWFVSIAQLVAIPSSILGGFLMEKMGPRKLVLCCLPLSALGWITLIHVVYWPRMLLACRAFQGIISTCLCVVACVYPCEIADTKRRGFLGSFSDCSFSLGFLVTYMIGGIVKWQQISYVIIGVTIIPCYIGAMLAPESPFWLARHGQMDKALAELKMIRNVEENVENELLNANQRFNDTFTMTIVKRTQLLLKLRFILPVLTAVTLLALKEASGQFAIVLFMFQIFKKTNSNLSAYWCSIIVGSTRFVSNLMGCFLLTKIPRRILLGTSSITAALALGILGTSFFLKINISFLPIGLLMIFVICYGIGIGPTSWLLSAEVLPSDVRSVGSGLAQASFNFIQWIAAGSFVTLENSVGLYACFWIYAGGCVAMASFVCFLPETSGKTFTEIEDYWVKMEERLLHHNELKSGYRDYMKKVKQSDETIVRIT